MKMRLFRAACVLVLSLAFTTTALAAGTPVWWDNSSGYSTWQHSVYTGTASNTGTQQQEILVTVDVPNTHDPNAYKEVWAQVEWSLVSGSGQFESDYAPIFWENAEAQCPNNPEDSWPPGGPPDGFMGSEGPFTPEHTFDNGHELSYDIDPQPACERIQFRFNVNSESQIDYRIEVQTLCFSPNAVTLSDSSAISYALAPFALGLAAIGAVIITWRRRWDR